MEDCVFCKIAKGEIDSAKVFEDAKFLAILDLNPNTKGMTLVMTKKHFDSDVFLMPENDYQELMSASKKVAEILKRGLKVNRVAMVAEGMGVNHAHIKLYPLYGIEKEFSEMWAREKIFFEKYRGYISTQLGPAADIKELKILAKEISSCAKFS